MSNLETADIIWIIVSELFRLRNFIEIITKNLDLAGETAQVSRLIEMLASGPKLINVEYNRYLASVGREFAGGDGMPRKDILVN